MKIFIMSGVIYFSVFLQKGLLCSDESPGTEAPKSGGGRQEISSEHFRIPLGASVCQQTEAALAFDLFKE